MMSPTTEANYAMARAMTNSKPASDSLTGQFDNELATINGKRSGIYGHPAVGFKNVVDIASVTESCPDPLIRHVLYMIGVKMCRLTFSPDHLDSWIDIAGYARTAVQVLDRRKQDAPQAPAKFAGDRP